MIFLSYECISCYLFPFDLCDLISVEKRDICTAGSGSCCPDRRPVLRWLQYIIGKNAHRTCLLRISCADFTAAGPPVIAGSIPQPGRPVLRNEYRRHTGTDCAVLRRFCVRRQVLRMIKWTHRKRNRQNAGRQSGRRPDLKTDLNRQT